MHPVLISLIGALAGAGIGWYQRRNLATLMYRTEDEQELPKPGQRRWVVGASTLAMGGLSAVAALSSNWSLYLPAFPLAVVGAWLAAVDLDVMRIPNRTLVWAAILTSASVGSLALAASNPGLAITALLGGLLAGGVFATVHFGTREGVGFGDVKLAALVGLAVGTLGLAAVWTAIIFGTVSAFVWAKATGRSRQIPLGPWLLVGGWVAGVWVR